MTPKGQNFTRLRHQMKYKNNKTNNYKNLSCPNCNSKNIIKWCKRKTQNRGLIQRYKCKNCEKYFTIDDGFFRMRNYPKKISLCLDLFYKGISTRQIQSHLNSFYSHNSSWVSIWKWVVKYSNLIHNKIKDIKLNVGNELQIDEMEYKTRGEKSWFIDSIDTETRYMVSSNFCETREQKEIKKVLLNAKNKTKNQITIYTTDGYTAYEKVVKSIAGYYNLKKCLIKHNKVTQLKGEGFNHKIEILHNSIRHRTKTFRGFKNINSARAIMKGYEIYYNFLRKHQAIGKCPYELATNIKLKSSNKWLELIQLNTQNIKNGDTN